MRYKMLFLFIFIFMLFIPVVSAKETCTIVSGNGKNIGSELKCGTEYFYVIENKDNKIKMLAKYNLYVGDTIKYVEVESTPEYDNSLVTTTEACMTYVRSKGYNPYYVYPITSEPTDQTVKLLGCRVYESIDVDKVKQDEKAVGTRLDGSGKSVLPLFGITYMNPDWGYHPNSTYVNDYDSKGDLVLEGSSFKDYLDGYKAELQRQGFEVESVDFPTLNGFLDVLKSISGKNITVALEYPDGEVENPEDYYTGKMDIKNYISNDYKWLYDVTYWLGSGFKYGNGSSEFNDYYISNEGNLCALGRGECAYLPYPIGNGVRPVVTIDSSDIMYNIRTITDGNGTIEVIDRAHGGDTISFKVTAEKGLRLSKLTIITDSGEVVVFNEEDIIIDKSGIYSISTNNFTMPYDNVTIMAEWAKDAPNPNTGINNYSIIFMTLFVIGAVPYILIKRKKKYI